MAASSPALADWTDRIKAGELPSRSPSRPVGVERNLVITVRDWLDPKHYLHDLTTTDRRNPTINAYGSIYGDTELSSNAQPVLDPVHNTKTTIQPPVRDGTPSSALANQVIEPVALFRHGADLGQQGQCAHLGDGPGRACLLGGAKPLATGHPGLLQKRLAVALGAALPARRAAGGLLSELTPGDGL